MEQMNCNQRTFQASDRFFNMKARILFIYLAGSLLSAGCSKSGVVTLVSPDQRLEVVFNTSTGDSRPQYSIYYDKRKIIDTSLMGRSEERRVGKEGVSTYRSWGSRYN